jgi:hypothetical protein
LGIENFKFAIEAEAGALRAQSEMSQEPQPNGMQRKVAKTQRRKELAYKLWIRLLCPCGFAPLRPGANIIEWMAYPWRRKSRHTVTIADNQGLTEEAAGLNTIEWPQKGSRRRRAMAWQAKSTARPAATARMTYKAGGKAKRQRKDGQRNVRQRNKTANSFSHSAAQ